MTRQRTSATVAGIAVIVLGLFTVTTFVAPRIAFRAEQSAGASSASMQTSTEVAGKRLSRPYAIVQSNSGAKATIEIDGQPTQHLTIGDEPVTIALDDLDSGTSIEVIVESDTPDANASCELGYGEQVWATQTGPGTVTCTTTIP